MRGSVPQCSSSDRPVHTTLAPWARAAPRGAWAALLLLLVHEARGARAPRAHRGAARLDGPSHLPPLPPRARGGGPGAAAGASQASTETVGEVHSRSNGTYPDWIGDGAGQHQVDARTKALGEIHHSRSSGTDPYGIQDSVNHEVEVAIKAPSDIVGLMETNLALLLDTLLAGFNPPAKSQRVWYCTCAAAGVWFVLFFKKLYRSDAAGAAERWEPQLGKKTNMLTPRNVCTSCSVHPDVVIVFRHPARRHKDDHKLLPKKEMANVLPVTYQAGTFGGSLEEGMGRRGVTGGESVGFQSENPDIAKDPSRTASGMPVVSTLSAMARGTTSGHMVGLERGMARKALLRALLKLLPEKGIHVEVWSSAGGEELFVGLTLMDPNDTQRYLYTYQCDLMVLPSFISDKLQIRHPPHEAGSAPPCVPYDPTHVKVLKQVGVLEDETELYQTYCDLDGESSFASSRVRILVIQQELNRIIDVQMALKAGLVSDFYAVHNPAWLQMLRERWASSKAFFMVTEPLPMLQEYFGDRLTFGFCWAGTYCKAIMGLAMFSVGNFLVRRMSWMLGDALALNDRQLISSSIVILLWGRIAENLWEREKRFFTELWEADKADEKTSRRKLERPGFQGEEGPSAADNNQPELHFPKSWWLQHTPRKLIAFFITVQLCQCVATYVVALVETKRGDFSLADTILLSGFIKLSELLFTALSHALTEWENHKYDDGFCTSIVFKQFFFQFVNYYWWFVCLCFYQKLKGFCPAMGCLATLQQQLRRVTLFNLVYNVGEQLAYHVIVKAQIWWLTRKAHQQDYAEETPGAEVQSKYSKVGYRELIDSMMQLVMALGYIIFFGAIEPLTVGAVWLLFVFHVRLQAWTMTTSKQRPWPTVSTGLGAWEITVRIMLELNTLFSACIVVTYGELFEGASTISKVTFVILWILGASVLSGLVNVILPGKKSALEVLVARKAATKQKLFEVVRNEVEKLSFDDPSSSARPADCSENVQRARTGDWRSITTFWGFMEDEGEGDEEDEPAPDSARSQRV